VTLILRGARWRAGLALLYDLQPNPAAATGGNAPCESISEKPTDRWLRRAV